MEEQLLLWPWVAIVSELPTRRRVCLAFSECRCSKYSASLSQTSSPWAIMFKTSSASVRSHCMSSECCAATAWTTRRCKLSTDACQTGLRVQRLVGLQANSNWHTVQSPLELRATRTAWTCHVCGGKDSVLCHLSFPVMSKILQVVGFLWKGAVTVA